MTPPRFYKCCMPHCAKQRMDIVHKIPRNLERQRIWLDALQLPALAALPQNKLTKCVFLCARHFRPQDYTHAEARSLNMTAVPSLNLKDLLQLDACRKTAIIDAPIAEQVELNCEHVVEVTKMAHKKEIEVESPRQDSVPQAKKNKRSNEHTELTNEYVSLAELHKELFGDDEDELKHDVEGRAVLYSLEAPLSEIQEPQVSKVEYSISLTDDCVTIIHPDDEGAAESLQLEVLWLRAQCRCSKCFDSKTSSRKNAIFEISTELDIEIATLQESPRELEVEWNDGHKSTYPLPQLIDLHNATNSPPSQSTKEVFLWHSTDTADFRPLQSNDLICSTNIVHSALRRLQRIGVLIIQLPPNARTDPLQQPILNELLLRRLFPHLPHTGALQGEKRSDFISRCTIPHTNCSFDASDCGLQVLSVSTHAPKVELMLVDGFQAAQQLNSQTRRILSEFPVSTVYRNSAGLEYAVCAPLIQREANRMDVVERINCALYHMNPAMAQKHFLTALKEYTRVLGDPKQQWNLNLSPDMLVILDNWRICWELRPTSEATTAPTLNCVYVPRKHYISRVHNLQLSD